MTFDQAWAIVKRKTPWCPYCNGNLTLASGEWNDKRCMRCNRRVKPYYATNPNPSSHNNYGMNWYG